MTTTICCNNKCKAHTKNGTKSTNNSKTCTNMQQTYQTNDKNMKKDKNNMLYKQMQNHIHKYQKHLQTIVKHVQKMQHTYQTNEQKHQHMTNTICCNNTCKKHTKMSKTNNRKTCTTNATHIPNKLQKHQKCQKQYGVETNSKHIQTMSNNVQTIIKHVQQMQQTYQTNDKNNTNKTKQYVLITNAKYKQKMSNPNANNSKTCTTNATNIPNKSQTHQHMTKTICCTNK